MVSFWPWGGDSSSPASFEKVLLTLSTKITATQAQLERVRSTSRRVKVLWTLYLSFAYLVYAIVLMLVVGLGNLGALEWTGMAGGPVIITLTRALLSAFFNFRIDTLSTRLKDQQAERAKTIQKLKDATKYDSTLELLEKYGGSEPKKSKGKNNDGGDKEGIGAGEQQGQQRAGQIVPNRRPIVPPPTANIPRGDMRIPTPGTPGLQGPGLFQQPPQQPPMTSMEPSAEFAPNAFGPDGSQVVPNAQFAPAPMGGVAESHWYDRIFDVLLGEDETAAKNRIVLICRRCRLVNGQAPPGVKNLAEMGMWRCMACGEMNGEMDEGKRIVREVLGQTPVASEDEAEEADSTSGPTHVKEEDAQDEVTQQLQDESRPRRRKGKGKQ